MRGEYLSGYKGRYREFISPAWSHTEIRECLGQINPKYPMFGGNQIWRCDDRKKLLLTAYCGLQQKSDTDAPSVYTHAIFDRLSIQTLHEKSRVWIWQPFASEDEFLALAAVNPDSELFDNWRTISMQQSKSEQSNSTDAVPTTTEPSNPVFPERNGLFPLEIWAKLACLCLEKGLIGALGDLTIVVPPNVNYLFWCRQVMDGILSCIPYGLRRYLSFAANTESGRYTVRFEPQGSFVRSKMIIRLPELPDQPIRYVDSYLTALIAAAAANTAIVEQIYQDMESNQTLDKLTADRYSNYWSLQQMKEQRALDSRFLRLCNNRLIGDSLDEAEKDRLLEIIYLRLTDSSGDSQLDHILSRDERLLSCNSLKTLQQALSGFQTLFKCLQLRISTSLSDTLLSHCVPFPDDLVMLRETKTELSAWLKQDECVLDRDEIKKYQQKLEQKITDLNRRYQEDFEMQFPRLLENEQWKELRCQIQSLSVCDGGVQEQCLYSMAKAAVRRLDPEEDPEEQILYQEMFQLLTGSEQQKILTTERQKWQKEQKTRQERQEQLEKQQQKSEQKQQQLLAEREQHLQSLTGFGSYWALAPEERADPDFVKALWRYFAQQGQLVTIRDFLYEAELWLDQSWAELRDVIGPAFQSLAVNYGLGVWLEPERSWDGLFSELQAYRYLIDGKTDQITVWYEDTELHQFQKQRMDLLRFLDTVAFIRRALEIEQMPEVTAPQKQQSSLYDNPYEYDRNALFLIIGIGMLTQEEFPAVSLWMKSLDKQEWEEHLPQNQSKPMLARIRGILSRSKHDSNP